MEYALLGPSGVRVSRLSLGTATFGVAPAVEDAQRMVDCALEHGINMIDTANSYGNQSRFDRPGAPSADQRVSAEELVGQAIRGRRDRIILATKVSEPIGDGPNDGSLTGGGLSRLHVMRMVERSLRRLHTDHIDIYYAHNPDPLTDVEDIVSTFDDLIRQGKIRYYAISNHNGWQTTEIAHVADKLQVRRPLCHQLVYSAANRWAESEVLPAGRRLGLPTVAYSPLGGGLLSGGAKVGRIVGQKRWGGRTFTAEELELAERFDGIAQASGIEPPTLALGWLLAQDGVASAIVGPETTEDLVSLFASLDVRLDPEQLAMVDDLVPRPRGPWD